MPRLRMEKRRFACGGKSPRVERPKSRRRAGRYLISRRTSVPVKLFITGADLDEVLAKMRAHVRQLANMRDDETDAPGPRLELLKRFYR